MTSVLNSVSDEVLASKRRVLVLSEDRLAHYPEFRDFFVRTFAFESVGFGAPGYLEGKSGRHFELVFIGRNGEGFPSGLELYALVESLEPMDDTAVDHDLWHILRWMFAEIGGEWSVETLEATGRLYLIPPAMSS